MFGATYNEICMVYADYVMKYGEAIVVFDAHGESSTKDVAHQRQAKQAGVTVTFSEDMKLTTKKVNCGQYYQQAAIYHPA